MKEFILYYCDKNLECALFEFNGERHFSADVFENHRNEIHIGYSGLTLSPVDDKNYLEKAFNPRIKVNNVNAVTVQAEPFNTQERAGNIHYLTIKLPKHVEAGNN